MSNSFWRNVAAKWIISNDSDELLCNLNKMKEIARTTSRLVGVKDISAILAEPDWDDDDDEDEW